MDEKRGDETQTEYTIRLIRIEAWEQGYVVGFHDSRDDVGHVTPNPYR